MIVPSMQTVAQETTEVTAPAAQGIQEIRME